MSADEPAGSAPRILVAGRPAKHSCRGLPAMDNLCTAVPSVLKSTALAPGESKRRNLARCQRAAPRARVMLACWHSSVMHPCMSYATHHAGVMQLQSSRTLVHGVLCSGRRMEICKPSSRGTMSVSSWRVPRLGPKFSCAPVKTSKPGRASVFCKRCACPHAQHTSVVRQGRAGSFELQQLAEAPARPTRH